MSILFGSWHFDGRPSDPDEVTAVRSALSACGVDCVDFYSQPGITVSFGAFYTTPESRLERQPHILPSGAVLTWDGRLDNRQDLIAQFPGLLNADSDDVGIVAAALARQGVAAFKSLLGDWALSLWMPSDQTLILAKDFLGSRHLYFTLDSSCTRWSTLLDALLPSDGGQLSLNEEYIAGWLSGLPAGDLTPYSKIRAVPASSYILIRPGKALVREYWRFDPLRQIRYRSDQEYEEHFRMAFSESVRRRLRSHCPVLAELSGGMDSGSIVCVADALAARGLGATTRLDTFSIFDDKEPNWNERPYVTIVEQRRGRVGWHVEGGTEELRCLFVGGFAATPDSIESPQTASDLRRCMAANGNRVVLSGIGGDEVTGGIPTLMPELADLLSQGRLWLLAQRLKVAALQSRRPLMHVLIETVRAFLPLTLVGTPHSRRPAAWISARFAQRHHEVLAGYEKRLQLFGPRPSFQLAENTLAGLRRQISSFAAPQKPPFETRYPFLDRDLLEFLFAVPCEQLVRPGQRRSLMRRALGDILPPEILNRKRKGFVSRSPLQAIANDWAFLEEACGDALVASLGIVDAESLKKVLQDARDGRQVPIVSLLRTITLEAWLRRISGKIPAREASTSKQRRSLPVPYAGSVETVQTRKDLS